ncbi:MAG: hypothetical protein PVI86_14940 [Phycisphaerae bacterium]|jgi:hypothetical protein
MMPASEMAACGSRKLAREGVESTVVPCSGGVTSWRACDPFQQLMLRWRELHPYNAAHAVILPGRADAAALTESIIQTCHQSGVGDVEIDVRGSRYRLAPLSTLAVTETTLADLSAKTMARLLAEQVNQPFPAAVHHPFRWLLVRSPASQMHGLIVSYDHLIADAFVIQRLLAAVLAGYRVGAPIPIDWRFCHRDRHHGSIKGWLRFAGSVTTLCAQYLRLRYAHRIHERAANVDATAVEMFESPLRVPPDLRTELRAAGFGFNDLVLAAAAKAVGITTPKRIHAPRRRSVGLSTVFSVRDVPRQRREPEFGPRLDTHTVLVANPEDDALTLVQECARQTKQLRRRLSNSWQQSLAQSFAIRRFWPVMRIRHEAASYRKVFPVCLGVSTFADGVGCEGGPAPMVRVIRACPTGPALPAVLAPTLFGTNLEMALTYRCSCFDRAEARSLLDHTVNELSRLFERFKPAG